MNYTGVIKLYSGKKELHAFDYFSREERNTIVERWKKAYPHVINALDVHVVPTILVNYQGRKKKKTRLEEMQEQSRERYERPQAIYSNTTPFGIAKEEYICKDI